MKKRTKATKKEQLIIGKNIEKLIREYKKTGKMKTSRATYRPKSLKHAKKIALAIEFGRIKQKRKKKK